MIIKNSLAIFKINTANDSVGKSTPAFEHHLHHWIPQKGNIFLDIGANIGFYSLLALNKKKFQQVHAFEPTPHTFKLLKSNQELNKLQNKLKVNNLALGSSEQTLYLKQNFVHTGGNEVVKEKLDNKMISVKQIKLDDYITKEKIDLKNIDYIKIDVEGFEYDVIKGPEKTLKGLSKGA